MTPKDKETAEKLLGLIYTAIALPACIQMHKDGQLPLAVVAETAARIGQETASAAKALGLLNLEGLK
jgi:hypothetical protein